MKVCITDAMYPTTPIETVNGTIPASLWMQHECERLGDAYVEEFCKHHGYPMYALYREFEPSPTLLACLMENEYKAAKVAAAKEARMAEVGG